MNKKEEVDKILKYHEKRAEYRNLAYKFLTNANTFHLHSELTEFLYNLMENKDE